MKHYLILLRILIALLPIALYARTNDQSNIISERKIVVLISSYNNPTELTYECLMSVLMQEYSNFEILFCDDCSPQPNIEQIHRNLIAQIDTHNRITYRRNKERYRPMGNQWHAFHSINPDNILDNREIIIVNLDGDDVLLHSNVLKKINELHHHGAWITWGQCLYYPSKGAIPACHGVSNSVIASNSWRDIPFCFGHIRTYRLSLLKDIPLEALLYNDNFYPAAGDVALMWIGCEKGGTHAIFNPEPAYGYRVTNQAESALYPQESTQCVNYARAQKRFQPLKELPRQLTADHYNADLVIFSYKRPMQLYALLESLEKYVTGLNKIVVLYRADDDSYEQSYASVKSDFENITFVRQSISKPYEDFKPLLLQIIHASTSDYSMFATDDDLVKDYVSITDCIRALQKTHADAFHLRLGKNTTHSYMAKCIQQIPCLIDIENDMFAWRMNPRNWNTGHDWVYPNTVDMALYPKQKIMEDLCNINFSNPTDLEGMWCFLGLNGPTKIGLCFAESKIVNIPHNKVQGISPSNRSMEGNPNQLHELFKAGLKIDINSLHKWHNNSPHAECTFNFVQR